ncbi:EamA family transporter [Enemella dayhoffiae]|uniref:EamA family transporter n=1 Tax=Enemella dayhoffiae TaxID=2016507 RepID=A0A255H687_9ACTN|nr:DMT family transporter [Enemella dayhoffiae]OYO22786.1 EamA family transporter [Enemella dayhoffiae]
MTMSETVLETPTDHAPTRRPGGLLIALLSAAAFSLSGVFGHALMAGGWSPGAVVLVRLALATVVLLPLALRAAAGRWRKVLAAWPVLLIYGALATAGCQVFYFYAVQRLSVSVALMLEYSSPVLIVLGAWAITRRRPGPLALAGTATAMAGLALVLNVFHGVRLDALGVVFGLLAAVGSAAYFVVGARLDDDLPPIVLATGGLGIGAVLLCVLGGVGLLPLAVRGGQVPFAGTQVGWWLPLLGIAVVSGSLAYATGIAASRRLGSRIASLVGLSEVLFACVMAWLLVGERPGPGQLVGGAVILLGVVLVKWDELRQSRAVAPSRGVASGVQS